MVPRSAAWCSRSILVLPATRGAHVHDSRYTDKRIDSVSTLALFRRLGHKLGEDLEFEYKLAQLEWRKIVKQNNHVVRTIVNQYCKILMPVICKDGKICFP